MTPYAWLQRWSARFTMAITMIVVLWGCATVPRQYVRMAEPGTTLTTLIAHPEMYQGKVVLLGGTIIKKKRMSSTSGCMSKTGHWTKIMYPIVPWTRIVQKLAPTGW